MASNRVIVVGSINVDLVAVTSKIPGAGETVTGAGFSQSFGGKGANQAVMAARFGIPVSLIAGVGQDEYGQSSLINLQTNGVDTTRCFEFPTTTGVAHIWVEPSGENRIVLIPGANHYLSTESVLSAIQSINDASFLIGQLEIPLEVTLAAFKLAKNKGISTILNLAPFLEVPSELLQLVDYLVVNETEFQQLHPQRLLPKSDNDFLSLDRSVNLIITLGESGAVLIDEKKSIHRVRAPKVNVIDTTGAGDALIGAFVGALALGQDPVEALRIAASLASLTVTKAGARTSYPSAVEVESFIHRQH